ncbi:substrate-binding domain-containing protein [Terriglobus saanensis]|uniref:Regulatory protein IclR n=1 Tax=Terriglobus saanensis (strain ATCC BAA-1853 / DSM 23119 / SP1PR4) TaxID=401053 RepID=E8V2R0_TERSS|nr:substrate-binding domain-containing protein [Terriglobus saanensis]ADV83535.1 regulatory protein IclR [Terriglobus saanensis SP1PR4]
MSSQKKESPSIQPAHVHAVRDNTVQSVVRACEILKYVQASTEEVSLDEVCKHTKLTRPTAYRLLCTLVSCGVLERVSKNNYRPSGKQGLKRKLRFGYASQSEEFSFSRLVSDSIRSSAYRAGIDLLVLNNQYNPKAAVRNADVFVREHVDLVIEFQTVHQSASLVASKILEAGIPMIAIDIPHPGATYYGADNYKAGIIGGRALGHACVQQWGGAVDEVILLELPIAGPLPRTRMIATLAGIREILPKLPDEKAIFLDGKGRFEDSLLAVRKHLYKSTSKKILLAALNDPSCLGGLQAFEEFGRSEHCLAVGQNASIEARREMRRPNSRLIGSVGYFPERYGEAVIALAVDRVQGREIPSAAFVKHRLITAANVDVAYPNDSQISSADTDSLLFSKH